MYILNISFHQNLKIVFYCLLALIASGKPIFILIAVIFSRISLSGFFLYLWYSVLSLPYVGIWISSIYSQYLTCFFYLRTHDSSILGNSQPPSTLYIWCSPPFFLYSSVKKMMNGVWRHRNMDPMKDRFRHTEDRVGITLFWVTFSDLSYGSLVLSSMVFNLQFNLSFKFYMSMLYFS